jgi:type IX secretion system PorP/SprF family membrane protein
MKIFRSLIIVIALFTLVKNVEAQQLAQFSQYFFNPVIFNPAYAGSGDGWALTGVNRNQWLGMPGAPVSRNIGIVGGFDDYRLGLGGQIFSDKMGPLSNTGLNTTVSYWVPLNKFKLSFGLQGNVSQLVLRTDELILANNSDVVFMGDRQNSFISDANFGVYLHSKNFYVGGSALNIIQSRFRFDNAGAQYVRHYYLFSGTVIKMSDDVHYRPSTQIRFVNNAPLSIDITNCFVFYRTYWLGFGFRTNKTRRGGFKGDQLIWLANFWINSQMKVGYSYDTELNDLARFNTGTHELAISYLLLKPKVRRFTPKFF